MKKILQRILVLGLKLMSSYNTWSNSQDHHNIISYWTTKVWFLSITWQGLQWSLQWHSCLVPRAHYTKHKTSGVSFLGRGCKSYSLHDHSCSQLVSILTVMPVWLYFSMYWIYILFNVLFCFWTWKASVSSVWFLLL